MRQPEGEARAAAQAFRVRAHPSAVQLRERTHNREPEPEPAVLPRRRAVGLPETVEDVRQKLGRDAYPRIRHLYQRLAAFGPHARRDAPALRRELDGVRQEVPDDLLKAERRTLHDDGARGEFDREFHGARLGLRRARSRRPTRRRSRDRRARGLFGACPRRRARCLKGRR